MLALKTFYSFYQCTTLVSHDPIFGQVTSLKHSLNVPTLSCFFWSDLPCLLYYLSLPDRVWPDDRPWKTKALFLGAHQQKLHMTQQAFADITAQLQQLQEALAPGANTSNRSPTGKTNAWGSWAHVAPSLLVFPVFTSPNGKGHEVEHLTLGCSWLLLHQLQGILYSSRKRVSN